MKKLKQFLAIISGFALILYLYKLFTSKPAPKDEFPLAEEKEEAEKEVSYIKNEIKELEQKEYSDDEIKKRFNK